VGLGAVVGEGANANGTVQLALLLVLRRLCAAAAAVWECNGSGGDDGDDLFGGSSVSAARRRREARGLADEISDELAVLSDGPAATVPALAPTTAAVSVRAWDPVFGAADLRALCLLGIAASRSPWPRAGSEDRAGNTRPSAARPAAAAAAAAARVRRGAWETGSESDSDDESGHATAATATATTATAALAAPLPRMHVLYMPHCPLRLYSAGLRDFWGASTVVDKGIIAPGGPAPHPLESVVLIGNSLGAQDGTRLGAADAVARLLAATRGMRPAAAVRAAELEPLVRPPALADVALGHVLAPPLSTVAVHTFRVFGDLGAAPPAHVRSDGEE
jgi:hypothetical protein